MQDATHNHNNGAVTEDCMMCGEGLAPARNVSSPILCEACTETADLPLSAYFLTQYYYRFAD